MFLKFDSSIITLCSFNIKYDISFVTYSGSFIFFLKFDGSIVTLSNTNIASHSIFVIFSVTLFLFSNLTVPLLYWAVSTLLITVLLSHSVVLYFFLTIDNLIVTVSSTSITYDHNFSFGLITEVTFLLTNNRSSQ